MNQTQRLAAYGLLVESGRLLLCRLNLPGKWNEHWTLPGGGMEFGEHPEDAVKREMLEETGLRVDVVKLLEIESQVFHDDPLHHHQALRFIYRVRRLGGTLKNEAPGGSTDLAQFVSLDDILKLPCVPLVQKGLMALRAAQDVPS